MNVICFRRDGCLYLCEFRNDMDKINQLLNKIADRDKTGRLRDALYQDYTDEGWNFYVETIISALEGVGCIVVWDN
jgi:hypothetical protein